MEHIDMSNAFMVHVHLFHFSVRLGSVCIRNREPRTVSSISLHGIWEEKIIDKVVKALAANLANVH